MPNGGKHNIEEGLSYTCEKMHGEIRSLKRRRGVLARAIKAAREIGRDDTLNADSACVEMIQILSDAAIEEARLSKPKRRGRRDP